MPPEPFRVLRVVVDFAREWPNGDSEAAWPFGTQYEGKEYRDSTPLHQVLRDASDMIEDLRMTSSRMRKEMYRDRAYYFRDDAGVIDPEQTIAEYMTRRGLTTSPLTLTLQVDVSDLN